MVTMQINISGHHVEITQGIRDAIENKYSRIQSHYPDIGPLAIILTVEKNEQRVETSTHFLGAPVSVHAVDSNLYVAIGESAKKLSAALSHRKGMLRKANRSQA